MNEDEEFDLGGIGGVGASNKERVYELLRYSYVDQSHFGDPTSP